MARDDERGTLSFPLNQTEVAQIWEAEFTLLESYGVAFDTGCGFGAWDWELDWSLTGDMTPGEVREWMEENYPNLMIKAIWTASEKSAIA